MVGKRFFRRQSWLSVVALAVALFSARWLAAAGPLTIPETAMRVVDTAHVLTEDVRQSLETLLGELEKATTAQVKVLTVPNLDGEDIFSFAQRQFTLWKLGQKGKSNGALIVLAVADRQVRIHTGYGLEGALPDSWIGSLSREIGADYFRQGKYSEGLYRLTVAVVNQIADDAGVKIAVRRTCGTSRREMPTAAESWGQSLSSRSGLRLWCCSAGAGAMGGDRRLGGAGQADSAALVVVLAAAHSEVHSAAVRLAAARSAAVAHPAEAAEAQAGDVRSRHCLKTEDQLFPIHDE